MSQRAAQLIAERKRREKLPRAVADMVAGMFPQQHAFALSPHKRRVSDAGRRAGKTTGGIVVGAFDAACKFPGQTCPIFERTLTTEAAEMVWREIRMVNDRYDLECDLHNTLKMATLPNGSVIVIKGADTIEAADKARGNKYPWAAIDEAGTYRDKVLSFLLEECLEPATMDFDGTIVVAGTPRPFRKGKFFELVNSPGWERHHWTLLDNPYLGPQDQPEDVRRAARAEWLAGLRLRNNWTERSSKYLREYMGEWPTSFDDRCYTFQAANLIPALPEGAWRYILALDLGFVDPTAFVILATRRGDPKTYVVSSWEREGLIPSAVAEEVGRLHAQYQFVSMVADSAGYGKGPVEEMRERFQLPVEAAEKQHKATYMEHLRDRVETATLLVVKGANETLLSDCEVLSWNEDRTNNESGQRDHLPDALLYGVRRVVRYRMDTKIDGESLDPVEDELLRQWRNEQASKDQDWRTKYREEW